MVGQFTEVSAELEDKEKLKEENNLPSYECLAYKKQLSLWQLSESVYAGPDAWTYWKNGVLYPTEKAFSYLPKEAGEEYDVWLERLRRSPWLDVYGETIRDLCGLLVLGTPLSVTSDRRSDSTDALEAIKLGLAPPEIEAHWKNLDLCGSSPEGFIFNVAIAALKHGHTFILVDMPPQSRIETEADRLALGRRPYWVHVQAPQVLNWKVKVANQKLILERATIREVHLIQEGSFGESEAIYYRVLRPGSWQLYRIVELKNQKQVILVEEGATSLDYIPLICVYSNRAGWFESKLPLRSLSILNLAHYQVWSDHLEKLHYCSLPVAVRKGAVLPGSESNEPLILGPHTVLDVPSDGDFKWEEPSAQSLAASAAEVRSLEEKMRYFSLAYLQQPGKNATAQEWRMRAMDVEVSLKSFQINLEQSLNQCLVAHGSYLGIPPERVGRIQLGRTALLA